MLYIPKIPVGFVEGGSGSGGLLSGAVEYFGQAKYSEEALAAYIHRALSSTM